MKVIRIYLANIYDQTDQYELYDQVVVNDDEDVEKVVEDVISDPIETGDEDENAYIEELMNDENYDIFWEEVQYE